MVDEPSEHAQLVAQHVELLGQVEAMLGSDQDGQPQANIGLLVEQTADGAVNVGSGVWGGHVRLLILMS